MERRVGTNLLDGPALGSAEEGGGREVWDSRPVGDVEAGAGVDVFGLGGVVLLGEGVYDLAAGGVLLSAGGAGPVDEETLAADFAADIADGVGDFAEYLHSIRGLSSSWKCCDCLEHRAGDA